MDIQKDYIISGGPARSTLFDAVKYAYDKEVSIPIKFGIIAGTTLTERAMSVKVGLSMEVLQLTSISHEDGSGESFNLEGYARIKLIGTCEKKDYAFSAYFNSKSRLGNISFVTT